MLLRAMQATIAHDVVVLRLQHVVSQGLLLAIEMQDNTVGGATMGNVWMKNQIVYRGDVEPSDDAVGSETVVGNVAAVVALSLSRSASRGEAIP